MLLVLDARHGLKKIDLDFFAALHTRLLDNRKEQKFVNKQGSILSREEEEEGERQGIRGLEEAEADIVESAREGEGEGKQYTKYIENRRKRGSFAPVYLTWSLQVVVTKCDLIERLELCRRITSKCVG